MKTQTKRVTLAVGEFVDFCPLGSGTLPKAPQYFDLCGCLYSLSQGQVCVTCNERGETVFRVTAKAGAMDGWVTMCETNAIFPECPTFKNPDLVGEK